MPGALFDALRVSYPRAPVDALESLCGDDTIVRETETIRRSAALMSVELACAYELDELFIDWSDRELLTRLQSSMRAAAAAMTDRPSDASSIARAAWSRLSSDVASLLASRARVVRASPVPLRRYAVAEDPDEERVPDIPQFERRRA